LLEGPRTGGEYQQWCPVRELRRPRHSIAAANCTAQHHHRSHATPHPETYTIQTAIDMMYSVLLITIILNNVRGGYTSLE